MITDLVVWWRHRPVMEVPLRHRIGWCTQSGRPHGQLVITSHHLRLDRRQIETALAAELARHSPTAPRLLPAHQVGDLSVEAQLRVNGHHITDTDLTTDYGLDVVGGITAVLLGRGVDATIVLDAELSDPVRDATVHAAADMLADFADATPTMLYETGWARTPTDRWELLLTQH